MENFVLERSKWGINEKGEALYYAELYAKAPYASITDQTREPGQGWAHPNCVRVYCTQVPTQFNFQIRTVKPVTRKGTPRVMLATVGISLDQARKLVKFMEDYADLTKPQAVKP